MTPPARYIAAVNPGHICPRCGSYAIKRPLRVPLRLRDQIERILGRRRYHCKDCEAYFFDRPTLRKAS